MNRLKTIVIVVMIIGLCVVIPSRVVRVVKDIYFRSVQPLMTVMSRSSRRFAQALEWPKAAQENTYLRRRIDQLQIKVFAHRELELENQRLRNLLDFKNGLERQVRRAIPAEVIGRDPVSWMDTLIINRGRHDGLEISMPVMSGAGVLGTIVEVMETSSRVRLLTHLRFRMGAVIQRTRHSGVVYGTPDGECRMKYLSLDADIEIGDLVETAGLSHMTPKGLPIGRIEAIWKEPGQIYRVASIRLAASLDSLEEVTCVSP
jgi:rod shape-determining protein MreC